MKTITAVPESITREQYVSLIESVGFDAKLLRNLEFRMDGIYAEVMECDADGHLVLDRGRDEVATNRVWIPVSKEAPDHQAKTTLA